VHSCLELFPPRAKHGGEEKGSACFEEGPSLGISFIALFQNKGCFCVVIAVIDFEPASRFEHECAVTAVPGK